MSGKKLTLKEVMSNGSLVTEEILNVAKIRRVYESLDFTDATRIMLDLLKIQELQHIKALIVHSEIQCESIQDFEDLVPLLDEVKSDFSKLDLEEYFGITQQDDEN